MVDFSTSFVTNIILWCAVLEVVVYCADAITNSGQNQHYGFRRTIALATASLSLWSCAYWLHISISRPSCLALLALLFLVKYFFRVNLRPQFRANDLLFYLVFILVMIARAQSPEVVGLQRPMNIALLSYFSRLEFLPPVDPWAAGAPLNYYYLGYFTLGILTKISTIPPSIGYNLGVALFAALTAECLYCCFGRFLKRRSLAAVAAFIMVFAPTPAFLKLYILEGSSPGLALWYARGQTFINESPLCSILLYQLHPHLMAFPLGVILICLGSAVLSGASRGSDTIRIAVVFAAICLTNLWDGISYGLIIALGGLFFLSAQPKWPIQLLVTFFKKAVTIVILSSIAIVPFIFSIKSNLPNGILITPPLDLLNLPKLALHFGNFILAFAVGILIESFKEKSTLRARFSLVLFVALTLIPALYWAFTFHREESFVVFLCGLVIALVTKKYLQRYSLSLASLVLACVVFGIWIDLFFLIDRMNTIYKFLLTIWITLGVISLCYVFHVLEVWLENKSLRQQRIVLVASLLFLMLVSMFFEFVAMSSSQYVTAKGVRPSIEGSLFIRDVSSSDAQIITWFNNHVSGTPTIAEASDKAFGWGGRIASFTGLPTVLGWEEHVVEKGLLRSLMEERKAALAAIYTSHEISVIRDNIKKYGIQFIVISDLERGRFAISPLLMSTYRTCFSVGPSVVLTTQAVCPGPLG